MIMQGINIALLTKIFYNQTACASNRLKVSKLNVLTINDKWALRAALARHHHYNNNRLIAFAHLAIRRISAVARAIIN